MLTDSETYRKALLCFENAVHELAVGQGDLRARLIYAGRKLYSVKKEDLPIDELKDDFDWINKQLTFKDPVKDDKGNVIIGQLESSLYKRRKATLRKVAERIVYIRDRMIYLQLTELKERSRR